MPSYRNHSIDLLCKSLFLSNWNTKKWIKLEWLKWNKIKLISTLPICILSTESAEQSCYKKYFLKQSKSKTWFDYKIPYIKTFLTWMEECLIFNLHFACRFSSFLRKKTVCPWHSTANSPVHGIPAIWKTLFKSFPNSMDFFCVWKWEDL